MNRLTEDQARALDIDILQNIKSPAQLRQEYNVTADAVRQRRHRLLKGKAGIPAKRDVTAATRKVSRPVNGAGARQTLRKVSIAALVKPPASRPAVTVEAPEQDLEEIDIEAELRRGLDDLRIIRSRAGGGVQAAPVIMAATEGVRRLLETVLRHRALEHHIQPPSELAGKMDCCDSCRLRQMNHMTVRRVCSKATCPSCHTTFPLSPPPTPPSRPGLLVEVQDEDEAFWINQYEHDPPLVIHEIDATVPRGTPKAIVVTDDDDGPTEDPMPPPPEEQYRSQAPLSQPQGQPQPPAAPGEAPPAQQQASSPSKPIVRKEKPSDPFREILQAQEDISCHRSNRKVPIRDDAGNFTGFYKEDLG